MDCIIPAGGASTRMGEWKLLLPWPRPAAAPSESAAPLGPDAASDRGTASACTVVQATVSAALAAGCRVVLVGGWRGTELAELFADSRNIILVQNDSWKAGMLGSIQRGMREIGASSFLTIPADMPLVGAALYSRLIDESERRKAAGIKSLPLFASYKGEPGHPVFIPAELCSRIAELPPGGKLRPFLIREGGLCLETGSDSVLVDLDKPDEYKAALARALNKEA